VTCQPLDLLSLCRRTCSLSSNGEAASLAMRRFGQDGPVKRHYGGHIIKYRSQDDPCEPLSETNCGSTEGCVWCKAQAIPSSCFKTASALYSCSAIPKAKPGVRLCFFTLLVLYFDSQRCGLGLQEDAARLPPGVFQCDS
jgi:hypothetical protein